MSARKPLIAGNWKMFKTTGEAESFTKALFEKTQTLKSGLPEILLCPPYTALAVTEETVRKLKAPFAVGAQNMESKDNGAYTGEISPVMLKDMGIRWVLIGHSERRQYYNETDAGVNAKVKAALVHGLTPVICVGESLSERESGVTDSLIQQQVKAALKDVDALVYPTLVFAYEPVWAIGTGKVCEAPEANRVCGLIRKTLSAQGDGSQTRVLYGGSVKPDNIAELMRGGDIDGALVGGASLEPESFYKIIAGSVPVNA